MLGIFYKKNNGDNKSILDYKTIRKDFPIFDNYRKREKSNLIYLDNASTSLMPRIVSEKMNQYNLEYKSNTHRGQYKNAIWSTEQEESGRKVVADFIGANNEEDIIWTFGATDSSNKLANMLKKYIKWDKNSEIFISELAHHSDLVVLQELANAVGAKIIYDVNEISKNTKIISHPLVSNVTGQIFDIKIISNRAKSVGAFMICDATAAIGHTKINVKELGVDALYFSGHKMLGPTGIGVLYINRNISRKLSPANYGGGMVSSVNKYKTIYRSDQQLFEAGTQNISGIIGLVQAIKYIDRIGQDRIKEQIEYLLGYLFVKLDNFNKEYKDIIKIYGHRDIKNNAGVISFVINGIHSHDVAEILSKRDICIRAGHHCAEVFMKKCNEISMARVSLYFYNNTEDIDMLFKGLEDVLSTFKKK